MDLEEKRKKFAKWMDEYMKSVNLSLEEAFALSYFYGYEDCIADHNFIFSVLSFFERRSKKSAYQDQTS